MLTLIETQHLHEQITRILKAESQLDLSTLATSREKDDQKIQVTKIIEKNFSELSIVAKNRIQSEFFHAGPLDPLLTDPTVTEIVINGPSGIWFEKNGQLEQFDDQFLSPVSYQNFLHRLSTEARLQANLERPFADGHWRNFRVHLIIPPLARGGAHLCLRRHPDNPWQLASLQAVGWADNVAIEILKKLVRNKTSFLIIGGTGSGKTSVLNACLQELGPNERIVSIEDTSEIHLPNSLSVKLISRQEPGSMLSDVDQSELLRQALRMRPERIVVGEVRGAEAKDLLMALSTGHRGGMGTLHADNAKQALLRLEMLVQLGAPQWSIRAIRHLILFGVQAVVTVRKEDGVRRLESIHKITTLEESGFCLERLI